MMRNFAISIKWIFPLASEIEKGNLNICWLEKEKILFFCFHSLVRDFLADKINILYAHVI